MKIEEFLDTVKGDGFTVETRKIDDPQDIEATTQSQDAVEIDYEKAMKDAQKGTLVSRKSAPIEIDRAKLMEAVIDIGLKGIRESKRQRDAAIASQQEVETYQAKNQALMVELGLRGKKIVLGMSLEQVKKVVDGSGRIVKNNGTEIVYQWSFENGRTLTGWFRDGNLRYFEYLTP